MDPTTSSVLGAVIGEYERDDPRGLGCHRACIDLKEEIRAALEVERAAAEFGNLVKGEAPVATASPRVSCAFGRSSSWRSMRPTQPNTSAHIRMAALEPVGALITP